LAKAEAEESEVPESSDDTSDVNPAVNLAIKRRKPGHAVNLMIATSEESATGDDDGAEDQEEEDEDDEMQSGISDQDVETEGD